MEYAKRVSEQLGGFDPSTKIEKLIEKLGLLTPVSKAIRETALTAANDALTTSRKEVEEVLKQLEKGEAPPIFRSHTPSRSPIKPSEVLGALERAPQKAMEEVLQAQLTVKIPG